MPESESTSSPNTSSEPYALSGEDMQAPSLPGEVIVGKNADELLDRLSAVLVAHALNCVRQFGDFHLALSGGSTPIPLYERLMYDPDCRRLPWRRTHLWIVDERCVPFDHQASNFRMISETIVDHSDIPRSQVHPIPSTSATADVEYEQTLREVLEWREPGHDRLDCVLLGMGDDGHTASLFPRTEPLNEAERFVRFNVAPDAEPRERVTMTYPLINAARLIIALVTGASKTVMLRRVASGVDSPHEIPILGIKPLEGELKWYLDRAAATGDEASL